VTDLAKMRQRIFDLEAENAQHETTKQELRNSLSMQKAVLDTIPDIVWLKDKDSKFLAVNEAFAKACGKAKEELIGTSDFDFWPHDLAQRYRDDDIEVMRSGRKKVIEETLVHSGNEQVWIETIKSPVYADGGQVIGTVGISRNVTERKRAQQRVETELAVAAEIQRSMLPKDFSNLARLAELDLHAVMRPAREVGGDFYDFFLIDNDHLCISVGDVAGKGVAASLFMAITLALLRSTARETSAPDIILNHLNRELARGNDACMFVTAFCGVLDLETGQLSYANAGHNPPVVVKDLTSVFNLSAPSGPPLGILEGTTYKDEQLVLGPGEVLFAYTDGVTETCGENADFFSEARLLQQLLRLGQGTCAAIVTGLMESLTAFCGESNQADDITMMALCFKGRKPSSSAVTSY